jgi:serine protease inhibitor
MRATACPPGRPGRGAGGDADARTEAAGQFPADHPFIYIIRLEPTGAILFMGRRADPTK